jgi:hypothetical protein
MPSTDDLLKQLEVARRDLLELSTQNRLLDIKRDQESGLSLEIEDEMADQVFKLLVSDTKPMRFEQGEVVAAASEEGEPEAAQPLTPEPEPTAEDEEIPKKKTTRKTTSKTTATKRVTKKALSKAVVTKPLTDEERQSDNVLHTVLDPEELDRRLLGLYTDGTASFQEQGVNILYLAVGFLKWFEADKPDSPRHAPLLIVPVRLERQNAGTRFSLVYTGGDIESNLTLKTRLKMDFGIALPEVPAEIDDLVPSAYFQQVAEAVQDQKDWEVLPNDMVLWFFSFSKLLMYRDLDPATWPEGAKLTDRPLIRALLGEGFAAAPPLVEDGQRFDHLLPPASTSHVIDCDSSQSLVVAEVAMGRNLVVQGPPGTGKSQTITNMIAAAVKSGKTILFVAEKMAALEVVKRRLEKIGIGDMCLELHSEMANKKVVLAEIERVLKLGKPKDADSLAETVQRLTQVRDSLNQHVDRMHTPIPPSGQTPYQVLTELIRLRSEGAPMPEFELAGSENWKPEEIQAIHRQLDDYAELLSEIGNPAQHPWRGSKLEALQPLDLQRLVAPAASAVTRLTGIADSARALSARVNDDVPTTLDGAYRLLKTVRALLSAPTGDIAALANPAWIDHRAAVGKLGEAARAIVTAEQKLKGVVVESAWDLDVATARDDYARYGQGFFRIFRGAYRAARRTLLSVLSGPQPKEFNDRVEILNLLAERRKGIKALEEAGDLGTKAFGKYWAGKQTDWNLIGNFEKWDADCGAGNLSPRYRAMLPRIDEPAGIKALADQLEQQLSETAKELLGLASAHKLDIPVAFAPATTEIPDPTQSGLARPALKEALISLCGAAKTPIDALQLRLTSWHTQPEGLLQWRRYSELREQVGRVADGALLQRIDTGRIAPTGAKQALAFAHMEALFRSMLKQLPELAQFDGGQFERSIAEFRKLDEQRIALSRIEIAESHFECLTRPRKLDFYEEVTILRHEMQKKRRHIPLRQLLAKCGHAIQAVKPVFMMSPLSVSQFLEPGGLDFDMLLIDEASQVRPVEALGAAARCRQMVCVGDDKQMPPTQFFGTVLGEVDVRDDDEPDMQAGDVESVLGLCIASNMPQRMLRWHYRSKHQSLIAVSNREFYNNNLYIIPSPERTSELGLKFRFIETGRFIDRVNAVEAQTVAQAVIDHAKAHPKWTLGVGAFSVTQRDAILKAIEKLRKENPGLEAFFDPSSPDPFFVKNLENIQGDERDVIYVSVGYGPDENGKVSLNFGPVSGQGGERRLNVLMTRAKRRCEIFSSMKAEDLDLTRATGRGPAVFRAFLEYAQKGAPTEAAKGAIVDDRFPEVVLAELKKKGYECQTHVGVAGVFIDLAVVDPHESGRYLLGVVCDGNAYRTSRTARDRDRLRDQVLTGQGWTLHHLWCWDWFQKPADQLQKLIDAIEAAKKKTPGADASGSKAPDVTTIDRHEPQGELLTPPTGGILPSDAKGSNADSGSLLDAAMRVAAAGIKGGKDQALDAALGEVGQIIKGK